MPKVFVSYRQIVYFVCVVLCIAGLLCMGSIAAHYGRYKVMLQAIAVTFVALLAFGVLAKLIGILDMPTFSSDGRTWIRIRSTGKAVMLTESTRFTLHEEERSVTVTTPDGFEVRITPDCSGYTALRRLLRDWNIKTLAG